MLNDDGKDDDGDDVWRWSILITSYKGVCWSLIHNKCVSLVNELASCHILIYKATRRNTTKNPCAVIGEQWRVDVRIFNSISDTHLLHMCLSFSKIQSYLHWYIFFVHYIIHSFIVVMICNDHLLNDLDSQIDTWIHRMIHACVAPLDPLGPPLMSRHWGRPCWSSWVLRRRPAICWQGRFAAMKKNYTWNISRGNRWKIWRMNSRFSAKSQERR